MHHRYTAKILIPAGLAPWPHELRVARILSLAGHSVEFLPTAGVKTADILLDGIEFEIKSPRTSSTNTLEHLLKRALKQSPNIIIDTARIKNLRDHNILHFLITQAKTRKQIKRLIMITRQEGLV